MDEIDITAFLKEGENAVAVELIAYTNQTLSSTGEASFLQMEIFCGDESIFRTDENTAARLLTYKLQDAPRFSHARNNQEIYCLEPGYDAWRTEGFAETDKVGLFEGEVELLSGNWDKFDFTVRDTARRTYVDPDGQYENYDFGAMDCGFIGAEFTAAEECTVELLYPDKLTREKGEFDPTFSYVKPVVVHVKPGHYRLEGFEPSNIQFVQVRADRKKVRMEKLYVRRAQIKDFSGGFFSCSDGQLNRIYESCRRSLIIRARRSSAPTRRTISLTLMGLII